MAPSNSHSYQNSAALTIERNCIGMRCMKKMLYRSYVQKQLLVGRKLSQP